MVAVRLCSFSAASTETAHAPKKMNSAIIPSTTTAKDTGTGKLLIFILALILCVATSKLCQLYGTWENVLLFSVLTANVRLLGFLFRQDRKFDSKSCACCVALEPYFTLTPDGDDAAHHVQSEARSLTYVLCREKWIKDMSLYLLRDT